MTTIARRALALAVVAALLILATSCKSKDGDDQAATTDPTTISGVSTPTLFPLHAARSDGKDLVIDAPVKRIVSLSPGATEILFAIGAQDTIAAVDKNANYPPEAAALSGRVDAYEPNVEAIAEFEPDLVIVASNIDGIVEALDRLSIPVLFIDIDKDVKTIDDVFGQIALLGRMTDHQQEASDLLVKLGTRMRDVLDRTQELAAREQPSVYHELDAELYSASEQTFIGNLYTMLRAQNIAGSGGGVAYPQLTQEAIIQANPDVIILADEAFGVSVDSVKARPGWDAIAAVENDRVYAIDPDIISRPGPRIVDALEQLARALYPEASS